MNRRALVFYRARFSRRPERAECANRIASSHADEPGTYKKAEAPFRTPATLSYHTASFAALTGRALTIFRAGLALNIIGSLVKGLVPLRALVAGFLMTTNFAKPGTRKTPVFFSS